MALPTIDLSGDQTKRLASHAVLAVTFGLDASGNPRAVESQPSQLATVSTGTPVTADGTVFTLAAGQKGFIQNLDDAAVYVKLGASASSTDFNFVLKAGTAANDGTGGSLWIENYTGVVSIAAATGSPRVSAWKLSA